MGLWVLFGGRWFRTKEYYYSSRKEGAQKTDEEYYAELEKLTGSLPVEAVIVDPSAASFIECVRRHNRFRVIRAKNDVSCGIRRVHEAFKQGKIFISPDCRAALREFSLYRWEEGSAKDSPRKENDHAMDEIRYFVSTVLAEDEDDGFFAFASDRKER